jgi:hypothetical protein
LPIEAGIAVELVVPMVALTGTALLIFRRHKGDWAAMPFALTT